MEEIGNTERWSNQNLQKKKFSFEPVNCFYFDLVSGHLKVIGHTLHFGDHWETKPRSFGGE